MADITEAIRRLIFEYVSEGADKVMQTQEAVAASTTKTDKASLSLEKSFLNLENRYDSTLKYQREYQKTQDKINAAVAQNPALQERANSLLANAAEHYDKLALAANKGGIASSFLSKAISAVLGPAGLMGVAVTAVGAAVAYMVSEFSKGSTTIEQALEEQNRLLKEGKTLIDAKASAEQKAFAQSKELTEFQTARNLRDVQGKLGSAMESAAIGARARSTRPTQVAGEMGEAPTGVAALGPGYDKIAEAVERLNTAIAAGQPGLAAFQTEVAKVGMAHPELAATAEQMIKLAEQGIPLEEAAFKLEAMRAALAGVATNAQLAALGFASIAQFNLANTGATEAAAATERMAQHTLAIAASYPGISIEVAKQLDALQGQLTVAQARTAAEQMVAQEYVTQNTLLAQGKTLEEAMAVAAAQREVAEANVSKSIRDQINNLNQQIELSKARIAGTEAAVKAEHAYENAIRQGASARQAQALASATRAASEQQEEEQRYNREEATYNRMGVAVAKSLTTLAEYKEAQDGSLQTTNQTADATDDIGDAIQANTGYMQAFNAQGQRATVWSLSLAEAIEESLSHFSTSSQFKAGGYTSSWDPLMSEGAPETTVSIGGDLPSWFTDMVARQINELDVSSPAAIQKSFTKSLSGDIGTLNRLIAVAEPTQQSSLIQQAIDYIRTNEPSNLAREEKINTLTDKLEALTESTDSLNTTMQDALSPYYSQDPRTTKLGFRAGVSGNSDWMTGAGNTDPLVAVLGAGATAPGMANGGSFVVSGGYSANDNRLAVFPVASGEEVVVNRNKGGRGTSVVNIDNRIIVTGSVDDTALSKMKVSRFQQSQRQRRA